MSQTMQSRMATPGIYTSVWLYNSKDLEKATRYSNLYFDLDSKEILESYSDTSQLLVSLYKSIPEEAVKIYFTGKKGFHVECEASCLGISPSNTLHTQFKFMASKIKKDLAIPTIDLAVYDLRRMWRLVGTKHQDTKLYKTLLSYEDFSRGIDHILLLAKKASDHAYEDISFNYKANEWYREHSYLMEEEKEKSKDYLSYFNKYGTQRLKSKNDEIQKVFQLDVLFKNCPAVKRIYQEAKDKKDLDHESRLFLCSILTYTDDAIKFLHEILSFCNDYNFEKSSAHINDWIKRRHLGIGGRPYTCERANSVGVGCGDCKLERKRKWIKIGERYMETNDKSSPSPIRFAYKTKKESEDKNESNTKS